YDKHLQIPFLITMLNSGLLAAHHTRTGAVELELLTENERFLWSWDASDPAIADVAAGTIRRAAQDWHNDSTWNTQPGPYCAWCPVRQWCPDRDVWEAQGATNRVVPGQWADSSADDQAPF